MTVELAILALVSVQTVAMLFLVHSRRADRRLQAVSRLVAASWTLLDRLASEWMETWADPSIELGQRLEAERRELNQALAVALRHFRREDLNIAFAVKDMVGTVQSDRLLYLAKQKPDAEPAVREQVNIHFGPGSNPSDLLAAIQRFREGIEEFQELGAVGYEARVVLARVQAWREKLPQLSAQPLRPRSPSDSIAPGSQ